MIEIRGIYPALVTPFKDEGGLKPAVDFDSYRKLVQWQLEAGVDGLVVLGSTGEAATLDDSEKLELVKLTKELATGKAQVIVGTTSNCTYRALESTQAMAKLGVDAALIATPPYNKPGQRGMLEHFTLLAKEGGLPVVLYDIPGRTCSELEVESIAKLSELEEIVALKDAAGDTEKTKQTIAAVGDNIAVLSGEDHLAFDCISFGGEGLISASASGFPVQMKAIVDSSLSGDLQAGKQAQQNVETIVKTMFVETNPCPVKEALKQKGIISSARVRLPLVEVSEETRQLIAGLDLS